MYSATLGRFLQRDPAGYVGGLNLYAYVRNNPLRYLDPEGLTALEKNADSSVATSQDQVPQNQALQDFGILGGVDVGKGDVNEYSKNVMLEIFTANQESVIRDRLANYGSETLYVSGVALIGLGTEMAMSGAGIMVTGGPLGIVGGAVVTCVGITKATIGAWLIYQGWNIGKESEKLSPAF
jgi:uncharacterized protein RhaS with RHS repeats